MRNRPILIAVAIVGVLTVGAIVTVIVLSAKSTPSASLTQPTWRLTTLVVDGQEQALSSSKSATLHFDAHDGQIFGSGGCNAFSGSYALNGTQVKIGELRSTSLPALIPSCVGRSSTTCRRCPSWRPIALRGTRSH